ncbi:hypothetical protein [Alysiella filiformis]|uniref:Uncharacterized protein n=1 Tax=Alysiella filiformis DSM 16848 TaxID=1120981 RepID=A0A286E3K4_9NEIS|nr:hypothetical protein [Alysiella filiformis]QMT31078.1 hypothetical protein H3L97_10205 [Alysiella filiformis]UBQ55931.1 hypothetical protein JF568_10265 [Alysiella filiformis DSM 16848]SOD65482.1 hypothetical protein SAMN02746062_00307 [Alysiella filiformis DSM 16848]
MQKRTFYEKLFKRTFGKYEDELSNEEYQNIAKQYLKAGVYLFWILFVAMVFQGCLIIVGYLIGETLRFDIPAFIWLMIFSGLLGYWKNMNHFKK